MITKRIRALFHPELYHGWGRKRRYFEGWYFKIVSKDEQHAFAFIPGIAMDEQGQQQAFIQVLDGKNRTAEYHRFDASSFQPDSKKFEVHIADHFFSKEQIHLNLPKLSGILSFSNPISWPSSLFSPGIMGPFSFVPFMECYHGIVSMNHGIKGALRINDQLIDFTGGKGYLEKDWGHSFPSGYIWMQSNHFSQSNISFKASVARIPWLGSSFVGFIAGIWMNNEIITFTTYNLTRLKKAFADKERVEVVMENNRYRLHIEAPREKATALASPIAGFMDGKIEESMTGQLHVRLLDKKSNRMILDDIGRNGGLEVGGNIEDVIV